MIVKGGKLERAEAIPYSDAHLEVVVRDYLAAHPFVSEEFAREKVLETIKEEEKADKEIWQNDLVQVLVYRNASADEYVHEDSFKGKLTYLSIKRLDKKPINDWQLFQDIKNEICGKEAEAIQMYPAESRLVNTANQYHLFVFETGYFIPFGFTQRSVVKQNKNASAGDSTSAQTYTGE